MSGKDAKKTASTPVDKATQKKTGTAGAGAGAGTGASSGSNSNPYSRLQDGVTTDEENSDGEELMIPMEQMDDMVEKKVQALMGQWLLSNPKQLAPQVASRAKDLPALDKLKCFKGETDTDELDLWLKELQRHCTYYEIGGSLDTDAKKLAYATSHLVGGAEAWWVTRKANIHTYQDFIKAISKRFRSAVDADKAAEEIYDTRQTENQSVTAFSDRFIQLLTRVPNMHEEDRIRHFRRGLLPHLQQKVKEHQLQTLTEVVELAIRLEATFAKRPPKIDTSKAGLNMVDSTDESVQQQQQQALQLQALLNQMQGWKPKGPGVYTFGNTKPNTRCWKCGDQSHTTETCTYPGNVCYYCKKPGHIKAECRSFKAKQARSKPVAEGSKNE